MEQMSLSQMIGYAAMDFAQNCTNCGECLKACPYFPLTKAANKTPGAVMEEITGLLSGSRSEVSDETLDMIWTCSGGTGCRACAEACPVGLYMSPPLVCFARVKLFEAGQKPPHIFDVRAAGHRRSMANVLAALQVKPAEERWLRQVPAQPEPHDVVIAIGCSGAVVVHVLLDYASILEKMGVDFVMLRGGDICCGSSGLIRGDLETGRRFNQEWAASIMAFQPKKAMFFCHACGITAAGGMFPPLPVERQDLYDFLVENIAAIPFSQPVNKVVAMYDSCQAIGTGQFDTSRTLLQAIPGVTLVEMEHNRERSRCCGGLTGVMHPDITAPIRRSILLEAKAAGADVLATNCNGCNRMLEPFYHEVGIEVRDVASLIAESVGVAHEDRYRKYAQCQNLAEVLAEGREFIEASDYSLAEMEEYLPDHLPVLFGTYR